jgi:hypothetical protein
LRFGAGVASTRLSVVNVGWNRFDESVLVVIVVTVLNLQLHRVVVGKSVFLSEENIFVFITHSASHGIVYVYIVGRGCNSMSNF